jgi:hypothetical protein
MKGLINISLFLWKNIMGLKYTEEQFREMLQKNSKLKVSGVLGGKLDIPESSLSIKKEQDAKLKVKEKKEKKEPKAKKLSLLDELGSDEGKEEDKKKAQGVNVTDLNKLNKSAKCENTVSDEHLSFLFIGAKLLSVNQIFAILQYRKYDTFAYKKIWHQLIKNNLDLLAYDLKAQGKKLPYFDSSVELTLYRSASRLVDEDSMSTMFKYIIDGLKRHPVKNPNGILAEDNPKIVHRIVCYSEKGEPAIGIKVKKIEEKKKEFSAKDILLK